MRTTAASSRAGQENPARELAAVLRGRSRDGGGVGIVYIEVLDRPLMRRQGAEC